MSEAYTPRAQATPRLNRDKPVKVASRALGALSGIGAV